VWWGGGDSKQKDTHFDSQLKVKLILKKLCNVIKTLCPKIKKKYMIGIYKYKCKINITIASKEST
jgi:hypothetical protein